jgi:hypothetical protein
MARLIKKHKAFLSAFKATASITKAAKACGLERTTHYDWLETVAGYKEAFEAAKDEAAQTLEDEAVRRAHEGVLQARYYQGKPIGAERIYSDGLMMFLLRALRPEKYRERVSAELTGKDGGPIQTAMTVTFVRPAAEADE